MSCWWEVEVEGQRHRLWAERMGDTLWIHHQGRSFTLELESSAGSRRGRSRGTPGSQGDLEGSGEIKAPMPGKIIKVLVELGQEVDVQQPLVVMEAMKMEYTLESAVKGKVKELYGELGQQVSLGQVLVVVG